MAITAKLQGISTLSASLEERELLQASLEEREAFKALLYGPFGTIAIPAKVVEVSLLASAWVGTSSPYSQIVAIDGVTEYSKVDLQPSAEQLVIFHNKDIAFSTENDDGVVTVYVIGDKPTQDYIIQATITEVGT